MHEKQKYKVEDKLILGIHNEESKYETDQTTRETVTEQATKIRVIEIQKVKESAERKEERSTEQEENYKELERG